MIDRKDLAGILEDIAVLLELKGENPFKCRAFQNAGRVVENLPGTPQEWLSNGTLTGVKGIGAALRGEIEQIVRDDRSSLLDQLHVEIPPGLIEMLHIPRLGPKKILALHQSLSVDTVDALADAARSGLIAPLSGFGEKTQANILEGIERLKANKERVLYPEAIPYAQDLLDYMRSHPAVIRSSLCGSLRRLKETVKDIDLVISSDDPEGIMSHFIAYPGVESVTGHGQRKSSIRLQSGMSADLRVVSDEDYATAVHHFTGSMEHHLWLRNLARQQGLSISEYGVFAGEEKQACSTEAAIYERLGLPYFPPELREGRLETALLSGVPPLIEETDLQGLLHMHTTWSDGRVGVAEMVEQARSLGYHYVGITDHSQSAFYAQGLTPDRVKAQAEEIANLRDRYPDMTIFHGIEADILADGQIDYDESIWPLFDFIIASVHSRFSLDREAMTERLLRAIANPYVTILGHLTGRLLLRREPYTFDTEAVYAAAGQHGVAIEINANPNRLDIDWREIPLAARHGVRFCICPDAHSLEGLSDARYGIHVARKAGLTAADILNTRSAGDLKAYFQSRSPVETISRGS